MATLLSLGDIAIIHYNSSDPDDFSFVFLRDVEAGTTINFTDNGWLASGGFRAGEGTVTYTAPTAITAGTVVTLSGLDLDAAGDQIIAYQGSAASPTVLYLVDFGDGNNTLAGDATDGNSTALPPGVALGSGAVAVAFNNGVYAGPTSGTPAQVFAAISDFTNWSGSDSAQQGKWFRHSDFAVARSNARLPIIAMITIAMPVATRPPARSHQLSPFDKSRFSAPAAARAIRPRRGMSPRTVPKM